MSKEINLTAKYDAVFKKIMSGNKDILIKVLETILDKKIEDLKYLSNELTKNNNDEKGKILDLCVETIDEYIDIEVNTGYNIYIKRRNLTYGCQLYCRSIKKGTYYNQYKDIKIINLIWNKENEKEIVYSYLKDDDNNITSDSLLYCEIYMDKVLKKYYNKDSKFINKYKYLIMLGLNKEELTKLSKGDEIVSKYEKEVEDMADLYLRPLVTEEYDREMIIAAEKDETRLSIAKQMLNNDIDIETIIKCTNLTEKEMNRIDDIYSRPLVTEEYDRKMIIAAEKDEAALAKQKEIANNLLLKGIDIDIISEVTGLSKENIKCLTNYKK